METREKFNFFSICVAIIRLCVDAFMSDVFESTSLSIFVFSVLMTVDFPHDNVGVKLKNYTEGFSSFNVVLRMI
jgi:hypothetical protein